jgi:transmembrane sensor
MHGPNAEAHRAEFEAWLARGALHLGAYNRAAEIWSMGKFLSEGEAPAESPAGNGSRRRRRPNMIVLLACLFCIAFVGGWLTLSWKRPGSRDMSPEMAKQKRGQVERPVQLATGPRESRTYRLTDGSSVTLRQDSILTVSFDTVKRGLRLQRGQVRFEVAHEIRPFVVAAGSGTVTARGTMFDVTIAPDNHVTVKLLRGSVDVTSPTTFRPQDHAIQIVTRLSPGEHVDFADAPAPLATPTPKNENEPTAAVELDRARLADLVRQANRNSRIQIRLADASLGDLEVSGRGFPMADPERFAARMARIFDLMIDHSDPSLIILRRR